MSSGSDRQNPLDLGYFNLYLDKLFDKGEIITINKDTYFRNIFLLINRIRNVTKVKGATIVKVNLNTILRGTILIQYIIELLELKKIRLRVGDNIN